MHTTLDIDEDILLVVKELAALQGVSMGKVLSDLARKALTPKVESSTRSGLPLFPCQPGAGIVTLELVNRLTERTLVQAVCDRCSTIPMPANSSCPKILLDNPDSLNTLDS